MKEKTKKIIFRVGLFGLLLMVFFIPTGKIELLLAVLLAFWVWFEDRGSEWLAFGLGFTHDLFWDQRLAKTSLLLLMLVLAIRLLKQLFSLRKVKGLQV